MVNTFILDIVGYQIVIFPSLVLNLEPHEGHSKFCVARGYNVFPYIVD